MGTRKAARAQEPRHSSPNLWPEPERGSFRSLVNLTLSPPKHWSLVDFVSKPPSLQNLPLCTRSTQRSKPKRCCRPIVSALIATQCNLYVRMERQRVINHREAVKWDVNWKALPFRCGTATRPLLSLSLFTEGKQFDYWKPSRSSDRSLCFYGVTKIFCLWNDHAIAKGLIDSKAYFKKKQDVTCQLLENFESTLIKLIKTTRPFKTKHSQISVTNSSC